MLGPASFLSELLSAGGSERTHLGQLFSIFTHICMIWGAWKNLLGPTPRDSHIMGLGWGPGIGFFKKLPQATRTPTESWEPWFGGVGIKESVKCIIPHSIILLICSQERCEVAYRIKNKNKPEGKQLEWRGKHCTSQFFPPWPCIPLRVPLRVLYF